MSPRTSLVCLLALICTCGAFGAAAQTRIGNDISTMPIEDASLVVMMSAASDAENDLSQMLAAINARRGQRAGGDSSAGGRLQSPCMGTQVRAWRSCVAQIEQRLAAASYAEPDRRAMASGLGQLRQELLAMPVDAELTSVQLDRLRARVMHAQRPISRVSSRLSRAPVAR